jgi:hypothetical protein
MKSCFAEGSRISKAGFGGFPGAQAGACFLSSVFAEFKKTGNR